MNPFDYLQQNLDRGSRVGYDSTLHSAQSIQILSKILLQRNILLTPFDIGYNPIDMIWGDDRPPIPTSQHNLRIHPLEYAGSTPLEKLNNLRIQYFTSLKNDHEKSSKIVMISASLDEIAWVYNIRGNDIKYNPTLLAYTMILNGVYPFIHFTC